MKKSLKVDAALGIILLGVVALLTNGTLPAGEIQRVDAQEAVYGLTQLNLQKMQNLILIYPHLQVVQTQLL